MSRGVIDYEIEVSPITPPLAGGQKWAAKVIDAIRRLPSGDSEQINLQLGEFWGKDREEAERKAREAMDKWIQEESAR